MTWQSHCSTLTAKVRTGHAAQWENVKNIGKIGKYFSSLQSPKKYFRISRKCSVSVSMHNNCSREVIPHIFTQQIFIPPFGVTSNVHQAVWNLSNSHRILWASIPKSIQQILQKKAHRKSPTCDTAPLYPVHRKLCKHPEIPAIHSNQNQKIRKS